MQRKKAICICYDCMCYNLLHVLHLRIQALCIVLSCSLACHRRVLLVEQLLGLHRVGLGTFRLWSTTWSTD